MRHAARVSRLWYGRVLLVLAVVWVGYAVLRWLVSDRWHWSIVLDTMPPVFLAGIPAMLLLAGAGSCGNRRRWTAAIAGVGLILGIGQSGLNWHALRPGERPVPEGAIHVVSWNTQYWAQATSVDRLYAYLKRQDADVYLLQEHAVWDAGSGEEGYFRLDDDDRLRAEFPSYHIARRSELLTLSRFPIIAQPPVGPGIALDAAPPDSFKEIFDRDKVLRTDLLVHGNVLSVYNIHFTVPMALDNINPFSGFDFDAYFRRKFEWRAEEVRGLEADVEANPHPMLIAGDLNCTISMRICDRLRTLATDAISANRDLLPVTWKFAAPPGFEWESVLNRPLPFWRVDWVLTAGPVRVHRYDFRPTEDIAEHRLQDLWISVG